MKIDSDADTRPGLYTERGCRPVFWGLLYLFSPAPAPTPGASGPLAGRAFLPGKHVIAGFPVSYTHLDVYKRQVDQTVSLRRGDAVERLCDHDGAVGKTGQRRQDRPDPFRIGGRAQHTTRHILSLIHI